MIPRALLAGLVLAAAAGGCSGPPSAAGCAADADCGAGMVCTRGTCAGNVPPTAAIALPAGATTHRLLRLRSESRDPEGQPITLAWSVEPIDAGCDPEPEPPADGALEAVFWCPGDYRVTLIAIDPLGAESAPAVRVLSVAAATGAPIVGAGASVSAAHRCDAAVPSCEAVSAGGATTFPLAATGVDPAGGALAWEWVHLPPPGADPALEARFTPGSDVAATAATLSTPGGAISGLHRFRVRARSGAGLLGEAFQEVTVGNEPPAVAPAGLAAPHAFADGLYQVDAELDTGATDADGDPLVASGSLAPPPTAGCAEEVLPAAGGRLRVRIACTTAAGLSGAAPRILSVTVADPNGGTASFSTPLAILNRAPVVALAPEWSGRLVLGHRVEPCALSAGPSCYVADGADPFVVSDPDGDPIVAWSIVTAVAGGLPASKGAAAADGAGYRFRFETLAGAPAQFRGAGDATGFALVATATDALGAPATVAVPLGIRNRAPVLVEPVASVAVNHRYDAATRRYLAEAPGPRFVDPDGDPISATPVDPSFCSTASVVDGRAIVTCARAWDWTLGGRPPLRPLLGPRPITLIAGDGWETVETSTTVEILDRPATVSAPLHSAERCACVAASICSRWAAATTGLPLSVLLDDPDGDPAEIALALDGPAVAQPGPVTCLPGWCTASFNSNGEIPSGGSGTVRAFSYEGASAASASFSLAASCATQGACCTP
jgi:hypothetical protein